MNSKLQCVLWDFGNTVAKEALTHASRELPDWPDAFKAVHALYGDAWDSGTLSDEEFAKLMAERLDVPTPLVRQDLEQRCASISFFDESLRVVEACRLPQVLVTVNPPLFSELIVLIRRRIIQEAACPRCRIAARRPPDRGAHG